MYDIICSLVRIYSNNVCRIVIIIRFMKKGVTDMLGNNRKNIGVFLSLPRSFYQAHMSNELFKCGNALGYNMITYCNFGAYDSSNVGYAKGEKSIIYLPDYSKLDGVILLMDTFAVPGMKEEMCDILKKYPELPVVSVREYHPEFYNVLFDECNSLDVVFEHLITHHGARKIYYVSGTKGRHDAEARLDNYRRKMDEYNIDYKEDWIHYGNFWTGHGAQMADWLEEQGMPDAVVCANDYMAISLMEELQNRGYSIPGDVIITGFDDIDKASLMAVTLTTVRVSPKIFAEKSMEVIDKLIRSESVDRISYISTELVVRDSCGCHKRNTHDYMDMSNRMYFQYENAVIYNERHLFFSRAAQNKKDLDSVLATGAFYSNMIDSFRYMHFALNESNDFKCFPKESVYRYCIPQRDVYRRYNRRFDTSELFPLDENDTPQRMYVVPLQHEGKLFGYVGLDVDDDVKAGLYFSNFLVTITNSIERIYQERKVEALIAREKEARYIAEKASSAKDDFLVNLSHEVRTPLNTIIGLANMLRDEELSDEGLEYIASIRYAGDNLLRMIGDILDFCQLSTGSLKMQRKRYGTRGLCRDIDKMLEMYCRNKTDVSYSVSIADSVPERLIGDRERIEQIMVNLCSNAAKFTHKGRIKVAIKWKPDPDGEGVLILAVMDTGIGMDKEDIATIFDAFKQLDASRKRSNEGSGMGLAVCNMLVKAMRGTIDIDSVPGRGSCFTVKIPQAVGSLSAVRRKQPDKNMVIEGVSGTKVLIVDDNNMNLKVEGLLLGKYGVNVVSAMSGYEAIDILEKDKDIAMVFMDYMMPGMDGAETTKIIRSKGMDLPVIAVTANTISGATDIYYEAGMSDYLPKPIDIHRMEDLLRKWIAGADV